MVPFLNVLMYNGHLQQIHFNIQYLFPIKKISTFAFWKVFVRSPMLPLCLNSILLTRLKERRTEKVMTESCKGRTNLPLIRHSSFMQLCSWATHRTMKALSCLPGDHLINKMSNLTSTQILYLVDLAQITFISFKILMRPEVMGAICPLLSVRPQLPWSPTNGF